MVTKTIGKKVLVYTKREKIIEFALITLGCVIFALGIVIFLLPYKIAPGGITGVAVIINRFFGFPAGITMLSINTCIFLLGLKYLGTDFGVKSLYATIVISLLIDFFNEILHLSMRINDPILAPIFGGGVFGAGIGIIVRMGGGTCGSNTLARILAKKMGWKQGTSIMVINSGVIAASGVVFKSADLALYGFLSLYTSSVIIDLIVEGFEYSQGAYIISERAIEIGHVIVYEMKRGVTALNGKGLYTHEDRNVLFTVMSRKEIHDMVAITKKIDPKAFVIITPVHEVLGEGFKVR